MKKIDILSIGAALLAAFFWSFSFIWIKIAYLAYQPITVVIFRLGISAILLTIIAWISGRLQIPRKSDIKWFFLMAFFEPFLYFLGESYGLKYVSSTVAAVIVSTIPLLAPIAAWYFFREHITRTNLLGLVCSFIGVTLVVLNGEFQLDASPLGVSLEFVAVLAALGYSTMLKKMTSHYNTLSIILYQNVIGILLFLPIWLTVDLNTWLATPFHAQAFRAIVLLAVFASTLAFVFFTQSVRKLGITRTNIFINLIPVFVAIMAYFILNDELRLQQLIGIAIVVTGLFLSQIKRSEPKSKDPLEIHRK